MKEDFFKNLPEVITRDILRSLPIKTIITCKCVCKSWRDLIEGDGFATTYTLKPGMAFATNDNCCTVCNGEDFDLFFRFMIYEHRHNDLYPVVIDSVNGLLLILLRNDRSYILSVCNPITNEYVVLPPLPSLLTNRCNYIFGFGVSKLSGKCKILCGDEYGLYICDLGEGWRAISEAAPGRHIMFIGTTFFNGNIHWLTWGYENNHMIWCFDLETELFTRIFLPPRVYRDEEEGLRKYRLYVFEGQLCLYDYVNSNCMVRWRMNVYGDDNSWIEDSTQRRPINIRNLNSNLKARSKSFILLDTDSTLFVYSTTTTATKSYDNIHQSTYSNIVIYTPSFYPLKAMGVRNVQSLNFRSSKFLEGSTLQST